jgi:hypothetical protein
MKIFQSSDYLFEVAKNVVCLRNRTLEGWSAAIPYSLPQAPEEIADDLMLAQALDQFEHESFERHGRKDLSLREALTAPLESIDAQLGAITSSDHDAWTPSLQDPVEK